jgi:hypothetical protein
VAVARHQARSGLVRAAARVDDERRAVRPQHERQRVGVRVRRQVRRAERPDVEHGLVAAVAEREVAGARQVAQLRRGRLDGRARPGVVEERQAPVGPGQRRHPRLHRGDRRPQVVRGGLARALDRGERVAEPLEDEAVVGRAALDVAAVGEDLARQLAREHPAAVAQRGRVAGARPADDERARVLDHVVAADVVLDAAAQVAHLAPQARPQATGERLRPAAGRQRGAPRDDAAAERVRVPARQRRPAGPVEPVGEDAGPEAVAAGAARPGRVGSQVVEAVQREGDEQAVRPVDAPERRIGGVARAADRVEPAGLVRRRAGPGLRRGGPAEPGRERAPPRRLVVAQAGRQHRRRQQPPWPVQHLADRQPADGVQVVPDRRFRRGGRQAREPMAGAEREESAGPRHAPQRTSTPPFHDAPGAKPAATPVHRPPAPKIEPPPRRRSARDRVNGLAARGATARMRRCAS